MKIKHIFMTALLFSIALSAVSTQETAPQVLTVDEAVRIALDNNLSLRRTAIDLGTRKRTADRSWNSVLPSLNAQALVSHPASVTGPIQPAPSMGPAGITYIDRDVWTPGFSLSAGITLSTAVIENINRAQADYEAGLLSYEAARQELELQVRKLFYQILLLDANCELVAQNFQSA
ncbi:MAG: TolC family protein, partial [Treponema sp.]|nr:TolC family protein [Treponema sp.]